MTDAKTNADVAGLPFEAALKELEAIVARLERGDVALEESIDIYTRGDIVTPLRTGTARSSSAPPAARRGRAGCPVWPAPPTSPPSARRSCGRRLASSAWRTGLRCS